MSYLLVGESVWRDRGQECGGGDHSGQPRQAGIPPDERPPRRPLSLGGVAGLGNQPELPDQ